MTETVKKKRGEWGRGCIRERKNGIWEVRISHRGKQFKFSTHSRNRQDAVKLLKQKQSEMHQGQFQPDAEKVTFEELAQMILDDHGANGRKSKPRAQQCIAHLKETFGFSRAVDIRTDQIRAYTRERREAGAAPATVKNELSCLKRMFNLALQDGKITRKPHIPSIKVSNARQGFFEEADLKALLSHLDEDLRPLVLFAACTGWRRGEAVPLQWKQVDLEAGIVRLEPGTTKNDEGRNFPFGQFPQLKALLVQQWERSVMTGTPWVFHRNGRPIRDFREAWASACKKAGLTGRLFHDLRRTAVRNLERAGVPRSVAMKLTGHKTESVYRRYAIVSEADLGEGVKKLAALKEDKAELRPVAVSQEKSEGGLDSVSSRFNYGAGGEG